MPRRVLIVTAAFPPVIGGGAVRNAQTAAGLAERGWDVAVLTTARRSPPFEDPSPLERLPSAVRVIRAREPGSSAIVRWLRRRRAQSGTAEGVAGGGRERLRHFLLAWVLIPDAHVTWIGPAVLAGVRLAARWRPDAILTSGPPHSAHLVGRALASGRRWVVDSQDPWARTPYRDTSSALRARIDAWLESRVIRKADVVASASAAQTEAFCEAYPDLATRFVTLPSGYDEREFAGLVRVLRARRLILHVGSLYGERSAAPFLAAARRVVASAPDAFAGVEILFAGWADRRREAELEEAARDPLIGPHVSRVAVLPRVESLRLMLGADVLLLLTDPGAGGHDLVPLKTFEYLRAGRPILAVVPDGETARILGSTGGALRADPRDVGAVAAALRSLLADPSIVPPPAGIERYAFGPTLDRLSDLLAGRARA